MVDTTWFDRSRYALLQKANEVDCLFFQESLSIKLETNDNQLGISYSMLNEKDMKLDLEKLHDNIRNSIC